MARRLIFVEDTFFIKGRGLILTPGIIPQREERFCVGDPILLRRPDGSSLGWQIGGIVMIHSSMPQHDLAIVLTGLDKEQVPIGTEVWST